MEQLADALSKVVNPKYQPLLGLLIAVSPWLDRAYHALVNGRGIKGVFSAIWLGTNVPAPTSTTTSSRPTIPLMLLIASCAIAGLAGCGTAKQVAYKTSTGVQITVEAAMTAYGDWLKENNVDDATRAKVANAYAKYQAAAVAVVDAQELIGTISDTNALAFASAQGQASAAAQQADQALTDLVSLLRTLGVKI